MFAFGFNSSLTFIGNHNGDCWSRKYPTASWGIRKEFTFPPNGAHWIMLYRGVFCLWIQFLQSNYVTVYSLWRILRKQQNKWVFGQLNLQCEVKHLAVLLLSLLKGDSFLLVVRKSAPACILTTSDSSPAWQIQLSPRDCWLTTKNTQQGSCKKKKKNTHIYISDPLSRVMFLKGNPM